MIQALVRKIIGTGLATTGTEIDISAPGYFNVIIS
jgi:hypothetical protein